MYFIVHGTCVVVGQDRRAKIDGGIVSELSAGSYFGELALITVRISDGWAGVPPRALAVSAEVVAVPPDVPVVVIAR